MDTFTSPKLSNLAIKYAEGIASEAGKKNDKAKVLDEHPEILRADFMLQKDKEINVDLLFFTERPNVWHAAQRKAHKHLKMSGNKTMRQLYVDTTPEWNSY